MIQWSADNKFFDYFAILLLVLCVFATVVGAIKNGPINASGPLEGVNERGSASVGEGSELLRNRKYLSCFLTSSVTSVQDISLVCSPQKVAFVAKRWLPNANRTDFLLSPAAAVCVGVDTCDVDF